MAVWERRVVRTIEYSLPVGCWAGDLEIALSAATKDWVAINGGSDAPDDYARVSVSPDGKRLIISVVEVLPSNPPCYETRSEEAAEPRIVH